MSQHLFNTTRGVDLFANKKSVLESIDAKCKLALRDKLNSLSGVIRDRDDYIIIDPSVDATRVVDSQLVGANPCKKIIRQLLKSDPTRFADITTMQVEGEVNWYKAPIMAGDKFFQ